MAELNADFWEARWQAGTTGWDIGAVSPPIQAFIDGLTNKDIRILIPGAGRAYEAQYLHQKGFTQVYVCDWAESAFVALRQGQTDFPADHLLIADFFQLELKVDLILEQTFFCAIQPGMRPDYVKQAAHLLRPAGEIAGLFFAREFPFKGPPFGGSREEYEALFKPHFDILQLEIATNSIKPRQGRELFFHFRKSC